MRIELEHCAQNVGILAGVWPVDADLLEEGPDFPELAVLFGDHRHAALEQSGGLLHRRLVCTLWNTLGHTLERASYLVREGVQVVPHYTLHEDMRRRPEVASSNPNVHIGMCSRQAMAKRYRDIKRSFIT